jgi:hypothetical protein
MRTTARDLFALLLFTLAGCWLTPALQAQTHPAAGGDREVTAEGVGADVPSAVRNAAFNALAAVVGSFVDARRAVERQTQIEDGLRRESQRISVDIREYSQGSIRRLEVLDARLDGPLTRVRIRASIKDETFKAYVHQLAEGSTPIDGTALFGQASTARSQGRSQAAILFDRVVVPVLDGSALRFRVEAPQAFTRHPLAQGGKPVTYSALSELLQRFGPESVVTVRVHVGLDSDFAAAARRVLESVSSDRREERVNHNSNGNSWRLWGQRIKPPTGYSYEADSLFYLSSRSRNVSPYSTQEELRAIEFELGRQSESVAVYHLKSGRIELMKLLASRKMTAQNLQLIRPQRLRIRVLNESGQSLHESLLPATGPSQVMVLQGDDVGHSTRYFSDTMARRSFDLKPWTLLGEIHLSLQAPGTPHALVLHAERTFEIAIALEPSVLAQARQIQFSLIDDGWTGGR